MAVFVGPGVDVTVGDGVDVGVFVAVPVATVKVAAPLFQAYIVPQPGVKIPILTV